MIDEPLQWLLGLEKLGMKFGLENIRTVLEALGSPQNAFASVVIAGTNGKGSVTAILDTALRLGGYRSARYTSPHLERLEERFVIDGREVTTAALAGAIGRVRRVVHELQQRGALAASPTFFEITTAVALDLFRESAVTIAVLEVGLGGRLDATNIVDPVATAITTIAFDHQAQLGHSLTAIAGEKAGIIKPGVPVVIGRLPPEAEVVVAAVARERGAALIKSHEVVPWTGEIHPRLRGAHQVDNAIVALAVMDALAGRGFAVPPDLRRRAVEEVQWPGRLELVRHGGTDILLDAAHNPAGAEALASYLREVGWTDATLLFAAMSDKDAAGMLRPLAAVVDRIICTTAPTPRSRDAASVAAMAAEIAGEDRVEAIPDPYEALGEAVRKGLRDERSTELRDERASRNGRVVIAGSMFLIGPLRGILR